MATTEQAKGIVQNVLEEAPYQPDKMGRRELVGEKHLQIMQIALEPGQAVPDHKANSNVHLLVLEGAIEVELAGEGQQARRGSLAPVALGTPMRIRNASKERATFLVIKTPHPSEIKA